jgi:hypothetical protein
MKQHHEMYKVLPAPRSGVDELADLSPAEARVWAEQVFRDFGGTQELFRMLGESQGRAELTGKLRNQALALITQKNQERGQIGEENPLFAALDALSSGERKELLGQIIQRAMPWAAIKLDGYLKESAPEDQYKCYVGVKNSEEFKRRYGQDMRTAIPPSTKMTAEQLIVVETSEPGRLVCYVELSGLPAPSLMALSDWYGKYRQENKTIPVHTHKSVGKFVHARELSAAELADRKADLELMIQAIALGVLKRSAKRYDDGALLFKVKSAQKSIGEEKVKVVRFIAGKTLRVEQVTVSEVAKTEVPLAA